MDNFCKVVGGQKGGGKGEECGGGQGEEGSGTEGGTHDEESEHG